MNFFVLSISEASQIFLKKPVLDSYWLTGFFEGSGCLSIVTAKKGQFVLCFVLRQADPKVLYKVKNFLGFGSIYCDKKGYWTFSIRDKEGLLKVAHMMNGKLVITKRLLQYKVWVSALNKKYGTAIEPGKKPAVLSWQNGWLTGFADAEGSFNILLTKRKDNQKSRLRLRFYLDQAYNLESIMHLQNWMGGSLHCKTIEGRCYDRLVLDTFNKIDLLLTYFCKFPPLTTSLMVRFIRYARVYRWYKLKQHQERLTDIQHLIKLNKRLQKKPILFE